MLWSNTIELFQTSETPVRLAPKYSTDTCFLAGSFRANWCWVGRRVLRPVSSPAIILGGGFDRMAGGRFSRLGTTAILLTPLAWTMVKCGVLSVLKKYDAALYPYGLGILTCVRFPFLQIPLLGLSFGNDDHAF